jgi:ELP3 family radical SAM enzyme/protein acetyltransferase
MELPKPVLTKEQSIAQSAERKEKRDKANEISRGQTAAAERKLKRDNASPADLRDPEFYKNKQHGPSTNGDLEDIMNSWKIHLPIGEDREKFERFLRDLEAEKIQNHDDLDRALTKLRRVHRPFSFKKSQLLHVHRAMVLEGKLPASQTLAKYLVKKTGKSESGVLVITVLTSPYPTFGGKSQRFSCQWNCYYCPNEPGQPRSYLHDEPSVIRANRNSFDPVLQFYDRAMTLFCNGHPVDKIELLVLGGTWSSYPHAYQEEFVRDLFFAANTFTNFDKRERKSLEEEKKLNETSQCKIIGLTLETRPDCITAAELRRFRRYGCTRVQLGIQHTSDAILTKINRGHTIAQAAAALELLKDCCYKIDIHLMPNLPGSSVEEDRKMFDLVINHPDLQADQWKIYPCEVTPWTVIKEWFDRKEYEPYSEHDLTELLCAVKAQVKPWVRLNRVIRDIPSQYILGGMDNPNLRQAICKKLIDRGTPCQCIRCREMKADASVAKTAELTLRTYPASRGLEFFLSFESPDLSTICGFTRLRLCVPARAGGSVARGRLAEGAQAKKLRLRARKKNGGEQDDDAEGDEEAAFPEMRDAALIRELHVYGQMVPVYQSGEKKGEQQHIGFGKRLMAAAEEIAWEHGFRKMAVIAGVGVRNFYRKLGYEVQGADEIMYKTLSERPPTYAGADKVVRAAMEVFSGSIEPCMLVLTDVCTDFYVDILG